MKYNPLVDDPLKKESSKLCDVYLVSGNHFKSLIYLPLPLPEGLDTKRFVSQEANFIKFKESQISKLVREEDSDNVINLIKVYKENPDRFIDKFGVKTAVINFIKDNCSDPNKIQFIHGQNIFNEVNEVKIKSLKFHNSEWNFEGEIINKDSESLRFAGNFYTRWFKIINHPTSDDWIIENVPEISFMTITHP